MNQTARYWIVLGGIAVIILTMVAISTNNSLLKASLSEVAVVNDEAVSPEEVIKCNQQRIQCVRNAGLRYEKCMETAGKRYEACMVNVNKAVKNERDPAEKERIENEGRQKCADGLAEDAQACLETLKAELDKCQKDFETCLKATKPDPTPDNSEEEGNSLP